MLYPFSDPVQLLFCFVCPSASAEDQIIQRNMEIIRKLYKELNGASSDSTFNPPKMYIRDVKVLSKCLLSQSVLHSELSNPGSAGFYIKSHLSFLRILKSVGWQISEPEVTGISALKKRIKKEGGCFCRFLQKQPPPIVVPVPTSFTRPFRM